MTVVVLLVAAAAPATAAAQSSEDVSFPVDVPQGGVDGGIATDGSSVYVLVDDDAGSGEEVVVMDPASETKVGEYSIPFEYGSGLAIEGDSMWVTSLQAGEVAEIDLESGDVVERFGVTESPAGVAVGDGSVWIADLGSDAVYEYGPDGEYRSQFSVEGETETPRSLTSDGSQLWLGDDEPSADRRIAGVNSSVERTNGTIYGYAFHGELLSEERTNAANDGLSASRFGLLGPTTDDDITVAIDNVPPVADAGPPQSGLETTTIELDGTNSTDPNGDDLSYNWTQVAGPDVNLENETTATPEFEAPEVDGNETLTFELNVSDGEDNYDLDTVDATVIDVGQAGNRSDDGDVFTAGQTNRVELTVSAAVETSVRDIVPANWTVLQVSSDVERVTVEDGTKYVYFSEPAREETEYTYFIEAPDESGEYAFGPVQVRPTGSANAPWYEVADTEDRNAVVGQSTEI